MGNDDSCGYGGGASCTEICAHGVFACDCVVSSSLRYSSDLTFLSTTPSPLAMAARIMVALAAASSLSQPCIDTTPDAIVPRQGTAIEGVEMMEEKRSLSSEVIVASASSVSKDSRILLAANVEG